MIQLPSLLPSPHQSLVLLQPTNQPLPTGVWELVSSWCSFWLAGAQEWCPSKRKSKWHWISKSTKCVMSCTRWKTLQRSIPACTSGHSCSKLAMSLVNMKVLVIKYGIYAKYSHFFSKNTCESDIVLTRTVNILTINEFVKLMMLRTTGPCTLMWVFVVHLKRWILGYSEHTVKPLTRLCRCTGLSEFSLDAHNNVHFLRLPLLCKQQKCWSAISETWFGVLWPSQYC